MAFNLQSVRRNEALTAPRVLIYGVEGIGKSTFAAGARARYLYRPRTVWEA